MPVRVARLYLLCFAFHRFRQINDNLIEAFIHLVHQYEKWARAAALEAMLKAQSDAGSRLQAAGKVLGLFVDETIADSTPFSKGSSGSAPRETVALDFCRQRRVVRPLEAGAVESDVAQIARYRLELLALEQREGLLSNCWAWVNF
jgi:hypothetical protein